MSCPGESTSISLPEGTEGTGTEETEKAVYTEQRRNGARTEAGVRPARLRAVIVTNRRKRKPGNGRGFVFPSIRDDHARPASPAAGRTPRAAIVFSVRPPLLRYSVLSAFSEISGYSTVTDARASVTPEAAAVCS